MKVFIVLAAFLALSSAYKPYKSSKALLRASVNDYLQVCQGSVSKQVETEIQETLQTVSQHLQTLKTAIDANNADDILEVIDESTQIMTKKIGSFQGVVYAAIANAVDGGFSGDQKRCLQNLIGELREFNKDLGEVADVTKQAASDFNNQFKDERFQQSFEDLKDLKIQVDQFIVDPSQYNRLTSKCPQTDVPQVMKKTISTLSALKPKLQNADPTIKRLAVESATGLLFEGMTLNAICHAGQNFDNNDQIKQRVLRDDSKTAQNLANQLNSLSKAILGTPSFFKRIFGY